MIYKFRNIFGLIGILFICTPVLYSESEEYSESILQFEKRYKEYSVTAHERDMDENKRIIENIIKDCFDYIPIIDSFNAMMSHKLSYYLHEYENKIVFIRPRYLDPKNTNTVGFSVLFGSIVTTEEKQIPIINPKLANIVGDSMTWRAIYFTQDNKSFEEHRNEPYNPSAYAGRNFKGSLTSYINISFDQKGVNAHEMMHLWQFEHYKNTETLIFPVYLEFQAMAFDLAYNAHNDTDEPINTIKWAMKRPFDDGFYYRAGKYFKKYFQEKGYTIVNLHEMTPLEREKYGIELLQLYEKHGQDIF